jgi:hypothetical protein
MCSWVSTIFHPANRPSDFLKLFLFGFLLLIWLRLQLGLRLEYTAKNDQVVAILMKTGLNNALLPTLFTVSTVLNNIVAPDSGSTVLFNIVDKCEQRGQQNIVQSC